MTTSDTAGRPPAADPVARRIRRMAALQLVFIVLIGALTLYLSAQITTLARQRSDLRRSLAEESETLTRARKERATLDRQTRELQAQKTVLEAQVGALQDRNLALRADLTTSEAAVGILAKEEPARTSRAFSLAEATPRVYIQVATVENERVATALRPRMQQAGFLVPRVERVAAVPRKAQVRYFRVADEQDARRLLQVVKQSLPEADLTLFGNGAKAGAMRPRHFELWF